MTTIDCYHAHVYYDAETLEAARALCEACVARFGVRMGTLHQRPVGPHPDWSCQLTVPVAQIGELIGFLALNRNGLNIFVHPETGEELLDHRDRAIWIGSERPLNLQQFLTRA